MPIPSGAPRPRNPGQIATGLLAWWRADTGVFADTGGTTPATDGGPVARWNDLSGNGRHATQATGASQPTYAANAISGYAGITPATTQFLAVAAVAAAANTSLTLMTVFGRPSNTVGPSAICSITAANAPPLQGILGVQWTPTPSELVQAIGRNNAGAGVAAAMDAGPGANVVIGTLTTGGDIAGWAGATRAATNSGANHANTANTNICACGRSDTAVAASSAPVAETAVWNRILSAEEIRSIIAYAKARYGL